MSHKPGMRKLPVASSTKSASSGIRTWSAGPTAVMRLPVTRTVCLARRDPFITSTTVTARMATVGARDVQSVSSRQAILNRIFITLLEVAAFADTQRTKVSTSFLADDRLLNGRDLFGKVGVQN
jgi:hypothetical protein